MTRFERLFSEFSRLRDRMDGGPTPASHYATASKLQEVDEFGSNPGNLRMFAYVPERLADRPGLIVILHGCTQAAADYDAGAGWTRLADRYGFAVLAPEQVRRNNPKSCFNWFQPNDVARDSGEALSIRQMVEQMVVSQGIAGNRIFVTGLSAGGAMTVAMLATYPEVFAGGAVLAGLPYGAARNANEAFEAMFQGKSLSAKEWGDKVRAASGGHAGPWPRLSIWHGDRDTTVLPSNAEALVQQWTNLHGLAAAPSATDRVDGYPRKIWRGTDGGIAVEHITVTGMAHGLPLDEARGGKSGPFMLEAGIPSSHHIAHLFGLAGQPEPAGATRQRPDAARPAHGKPAANDASSHGLPGNVAAVISKALKSAGLLRG